MARTREIRPWYRWQWHRFANSRKVLRMGLAARGAYRGLLDKSWELGGKLPNDPEIMWRYAGALSAEEFAPIAAQVLEMFSVSQDGKWLTNETLTEEWDATGEYLADISEKRSQAGKKGNEKRWPRKTSQVVATPRKVSHSSSSNTVAIQDQVLEPPTPLKSAHQPISDHEVEDGVTRILNLYPVIVGKDRTEKAIMQAIQAEKIDLGTEAEAIAYLEVLTAKYARIVEPFRNDRRLWEQVPRPWNWFGKGYYKAESTWVPVGAFDNEKGKPTQVAINQPSHETWDEMPDETKHAMADVTWRQVGKEINRVPEHMRPYVKAKAAGGAA